MREELKPCPFCGGEARIDEVDGYRPTSPVSYRPTCVDDCGVYFIDYNTREMALSAWNRRVEKEKEWEPVPDGVYGDIFTKENQLAIPHEDVTGVNLIWSNRLSDEIRLCRRRKEGESEDK